MTRPFPAQITRRSARQPTLAWVIRERGNRTMKEAVMALIRADLFNHYVFDRADTRLYGVFVTSGQTL